MEQLVARRAHNPKVVGSSPAPATSEVKSLKSKDLRLFCVKMQLKITCQEITQNSADPILAKAKQKTDCLPKE